jgi:hypothetical protein
MSMTRRLPLLLGATLLGCGFVWALGDVHAEEPNQQKLRELDKWRSDPERFARLQRALQAFLSLPPERQTQMRQLDQALHDEDSKSYARLNRVLERYADWLQRLPAADRQRIEASTDAGERLGIIKEIRDREWLDHLPRATREELRGLPADKQQVRVKELREQEKKRREDWRVAIGNWELLAQKRQQLSRLQKDLPDIRAFVNESLRPMLGPPELQRLDAVDGRTGPRYFATVVELADEHAIALPGPTNGPKTYEEIPEENRKILPGLMNPANRPPHLQDAEGKWPRYAEVFSNIAVQRKKELPKQLGPSRPEEFSQAVGTHIKQKLIPVLSTDDLNRLKQAEGHWPQYPRTMLQLSRSHGLPVPGMSLPGPRDAWNAFRLDPVARAVALPDVADQVLHEFVRAELTVAERAALPSLSLADPAVRSQVKALYFRKHPKELARLRQTDKKKQDGKANRAQP